MRISELQEEIKNWSISKGWHENWEDSAKLLLIITEIAEAFEEIRNHRTNCEIYTSENNKPEGVPVELADAIIRILDYAGYHGINLEAAIKLKMEYNKTRPYRHGGKKA